MLEIEVERNEVGVVVCPTGELDTSTVVSFRECLAELATESKVVVDLRAVPFMDSTGLGALIGGIRKIREGGGEVSVVCDRPSVLRLLHTTGFDRMVTVTPDRPQSPMGQSAADELRADQSASGHT